MLSTGRRRSLFYSLWFKTRGEKKLTRRERQKHSTLRFSQSIKSHWWFYKSIRIILSPAFVTSQKDRHTPSFPPPPPPARERECVCVCVCVRARARASEREKERERERAFETIRREEEEGVREELDIHHWKRREILYENRFEFRARRSETTAWGTSRTSKSRISRIIC